MKKRLVAAGISLLFSATVNAQTASGISDDAIRIGLLLDMSSHYADITGTGSVAAAQTPTNDFFAKNGRIRDHGRMVHDMYLFEVKEPAESRYS